MSAAARDFNPIVEVFDPYSTPFTKQQESNRGTNQQTNYECSSVVQCSACGACSACG